MVLNWQQRLLYNKLWKQLWHNHVFSERIWPLNDSPCVFPNDVILCEYEEWPVDGEAVLPVGDGVVQSHGPGPLRLGLFHGSCESGRHRRCVLPVPALLQVPIPGIHSAGSGLVSKPSHSTNRWGDRRLKSVLLNTTSCKGKCKVELSDKNDPPSIHWQRLERQNPPPKVADFYHSISTRRKKRVISFSWIIF